MPQIFRGIHLDPLRPGNSFYLLWMILGFLVVSSVLVVSLGRLGDMFGRVRMYTLGFVIYTASSLLLTIDWMTGPAGADLLIVWRIVQGIGAAFLIANSVAILTDAFPAHQRGLALGINNVVAISGVFLGLVLGGVLAAVNWRLIFLVSVPFGLAGTIWSRFSLREIGVPPRGEDRLVGQPDLRGRPRAGHDRDHLRHPPVRRPPDGLDEPVRARRASPAGSRCSPLFVVVELRTEAPMFELSLFRIRPYTFGIALELPRRARPRRADVHADHLAAGHLAAAARLQLRVARRSGPGSTCCRSRPGSSWQGRSPGSSPTATARGRSRPAGCSARPSGSCCSRRFPPTSPTREFAAIVFLMGLSMGAFASPNRAGVMNSLPARHRGAGGGMNQTFQNSAQVLSIGIFFTLMIIGLAATLPHALTSGLEANGVPPATAHHVSQLPPISVALRGLPRLRPGEDADRPARARPTCRPRTPPRSRRTASSPQLIAAPFRNGLHQAFTFAIAICLVAAAASWSRGPKAVPSDLDRKLPDEVENLVGVHVD